MHYLLSILLIALLGLTACTPVPAENEIKIQVAKAVLKDGREKIFIPENFKKINGLSQKDNTYIAEVTYNLVFRKGLPELTEELQQQATKSPIGALGAGLEIMSQLMQYGQFKAGDSVAYHEKFKLIKTEQGWRLADDFSL